MIVFSGLQPGQDEPLRHLEVQRLPLMAEQQTEDLAVALLRATRELHELRAQNERLEGVIDRLLVEKAALAEELLRRGGDPT